jgi:hypothetical protein
VDHLIILRFLDEPDDAEIIGIGEGLYHKNSPTRNSTVLIDIFVEKNAVANRIVTKGTSTALTFAGCTLGESSGSSGKELVLPTPSPSGEKPSWSGGLIGIHVCGHGMGTGTVGCLNAETLANEILSYQLPKIHKISLVSCSTVEDDSVAELANKHRHKCFLEKFSESIFAQGYRPKIGGWIGFISVVFTGMDDTMRPWTTGTVQFPKADLNKYVGKKIGTGSWSGKKRVFVSKPGATEAKCDNYREKNKVICLYDEGSGKAVLLPWAKGQWMLES